MVIVHCRASTRLLILIQSLGQSGCCPHYRTCTGCVDSNCFYVCTVCTAKYIVSVSQCHKVSMPQDLKISMFQCVVSQLLSFFLFTPFHFARVCLYRCWAKWWTWLRATTKCTVSAREAFWTTISGVFSEPRDKMSESRWVCFWGVFCFLMDWKVVRCANCALFHTLSRLIVVMYCLSHCLAGHTTSTLLCVDACIV